MTLSTRNLRHRINLARYAAAPERRITGSMKRGREFVFFIRHENGRRHGGAA